jgi:hypothetical protein
MEERQMGENNSLTPRDDRAVASKIDTSAEVLAMLVFRLDNGAFDYWVHAGPQAREKYRAMVRNAKQPEDLWRAPR